MYLNKAQQRYQTYAFGHKLRPIKGCTDSDIADLEDALRLELPAAYVEFLRWMGHDAGDLLIGTDYAYAIVPRLRTWAQELLDEDVYTTPLPQDAIVTSMHQGYQFLFIRAAEGDDPPVYYYREGMQEPDFIKKFASFSMYITHIVDEFIQYRQ